MSLTLRKLLHNPQLHLKLLSAGEDYTLEQALDTSFEWLHATDLIDPTPFLGPAEVILTLGWQFPITNPADPSIRRDKISEKALAEIYENYAALVATHGVIGIGFGSDVIHRGVPEQLVRACKNHGLILFDVPYEISFMDLLQEAARVMQRDQSERYARSQRAQKAIANAAIRRDGLTATLRETARQLGCGVALFDSHAQPVTVVDAPFGIKLGETTLQEAARESLHSHQRFRSVQLTQETEAVVQLLGEPGEPTGALVLTLNRGYDELSRNVMSSVLALVSVSLEQNQAISHLRAQLRDSTLALLLCDGGTAAKHVSHHMETIPNPPFTTLALTPKHPAGSNILPTLENLQASSAEPLFFATHNGTIVLLVPEGQQDVVLELLGGLPCWIGQSHCASWPELAKSLTEASKAAQHGQQRRKHITNFAELWRDGIADLVNPAEGQLIARRMFAPLLEAPNSSELLAALASWLRHNGRLLPAARELGIHRHTLQTRLEQVADAMQMDLDDYQVRAELTLALRYTDIDS